MNFQPFRLYKFVSRLLLKTETTNTLATPALKHVLATSSSSKKDFLPAYIVHQS